ncbi:MAG: hypothetical protein COT73_05250, partial [Bdellovibrio sp. CG10_big_fil_rev_8_21_14_0_10_47_8]
MSARLNFLCISSGVNFLKRCQDLATEFEYSFYKIPTVDVLIDEPLPFEQVQIVVLDTIHVSKQEEIIGAVQTARQFLKESFISVIANKKMPSEVASFVKKSGGNHVLLENEFFETSRLEFIASQTIRAAYVPVKLNEFPKDAVLDFTLFHLMPLNQKLLPILPKGSPLSEGRQKKFEGIGEVYVRREEVDLYRAYVDAHQDRSAQGLKSRCRAQYLSLCNSHSQLIFLLTDQSEGASFKEGKWLYDRCELLAKDLLTTLSAVGEAWDVVNNSSLGEMGSVERCPTTAAYSGLLSLLTSVGEPTDVMISSLLSDVGMLELHPRVTKKIRANYGPEALTQEELAEYQKHPIFGVNQCLSRTLALKDSVKQAILGSHEKTDG